jgi:hypothetical protein
MDLEETEARNDCAGETSSNLTDRPTDETYAVENVRKLPSRIGCGSRQPARTGSIEHER